MVSQHTTPGPMPSKEGLGLSSAEAQQRIYMYGRNHVLSQIHHPLWRQILNAWSPVSYLLVAAVAFELILARPIVALLMAVLLGFNVAIRFFQEYTSQNAMEHLLQQLSLPVEVLRDHTWQAVPAESLVPGDVVMLRTGNLVPADAKLLTGQLTLTPSLVNAGQTFQEVHPAEMANAGMIIQAGEATAEVKATGESTMIARSFQPPEWVLKPGSFQHQVFQIARNITLFDVALVVLVLIYAFVDHQSILQMLPFACVLLAASIPGSLSSSFTLAAVLGAQELAQEGVLVTQLGAIETTAEMDVLCMDKTGNLTKNRLAVARILAYRPYSETDVLRLAAMASDETSEDRIDRVILEEAKMTGALPRLSQRRSFTPFTPASRRTEAVYDEAGIELQILKGSPPAVLDLSESSLENVYNDINALCSHGYRVLAVAVGVQGDAHRVAGLVALRDPPREDSRPLVNRLRNLGLRVVMFSDEGRQTTQALARQVGLEGNCCSTPSVNGTTNVDCEVYAEVLPQDKSQLVQAYRQAGYVVGTTGEKVGDTEILSQANLGLAGPEATDTIKTSASLLLTHPGLVNVVSAVTASRQIFQRFLTFTFSRIINTFTIAVFLGLGYLFSGQLLISPLLLALLVIANEMIASTIASDRPSVSAHPEHWREESLVLVALSIALPALLFSFGVDWIGQDLLHLPLAQFQTLIFVLLAFSGIGLIYLAREPHHLWSSRPGKWLWVATVVDVVAVLLFSTLGIFMAPIPVGDVLLLLVFVLVLLFLVDAIKARTFDLLQID